MEKEDTTPPQEDSQTMGEEDSQIIPLAPRRIIRSDSEVPTIKADSLGQHQKSSKLLVHMLSTIVILSIIMLILGLTILRINTPDVRLRSVEVQNLRYGSTPGPWLHLDMVAQLSVYNNNFGPFKFQNSSAAAFYGNVTLGVTNINAGRVSFKDTKRLNITVGVRGDDNTLLNTSSSNMNFSGDIGSRMVALRSYAEVKGEVEVIKIINSRRTAIMNCTMKLNLTSRQFQELLCA